MNKIITLRPHHLMCITFFKGNGYSDDFINNMSAIISRLNNGDTQIILTNAGDDICSHCPKYSNDICSDEFKSKKYDDKVLSLLGLDDYYLDPHPIPYSILGHLTEKFILSKGHRKKICGDCEWSSICKHQIK